jgi:hypothetical protein
MRILLFLAGILLSGTAAYYSVLGLAAIFNGAVTPIIVMGISLEFAKVVTASYLYRNWKHISIAMKSYMTIAVMMLVLLTSMGIFGFLSKAHLEHAATSGADVSAVYEEVKSEVDVDNKIIADADRQLSMLDQTAKDYNTIRQQQRMRKEIVADKKAAIKRLRENNKKLAQANLEVKKIEAEVGPLKYIAELIYGKYAGSHLDSAVRAVIMMLIFVFDPLAILLLIASSTSVTPLPKPQKDKDVVMLDKDDDSIVLEVSSDSDDEVDVVKISKKDILEMIKNGEK